MDSIGGAGVDHHPDLILLLGNKEDSHETPRTPAVGDEAKLGEAAEELLAKAPRPLKPLVHVGLDDSASGGGGLQVLRRAAGTK